MRNSKFNINLNTGHFIVTSEGVIYEEDLMKNYAAKPKEVHLFESEWDFHNNLLSFTMNGVDAVHVLEDVKNPYYKLANQIKDGQLSLMRYERI